MHMMRYINLFRNCLHFSKYNTSSFSTKGSLLVERLKKRTVLKLSGSDTTNYLQSMMTNDIKNFETLPSLYSMLLNSKGRVLYDILLYKVCDNEYLVEYDSTAVEYLEKHLIMYRLRKNVKIQHLTDFFVWVVYKPFEDISDNVLNSNFLINQLHDINGVIKAVEDPRNKCLGVRVITSKFVDLLKVMPSELNCIEGDLYRLLRYKLGIGEGVLDHPPGNCQPFEANVDLLNGVSFTKGCYIGQEMTAKSRHVFVIRKRLMPIVLQEMDSYPTFPPECLIENENCLKLGRFRSHLGRHGLALLKYEDCAKAKLLKLKGFNITLETAKPKWWPSNLRYENL